MKMAPFCAQASGWLCRQWKMDAFRVPRRRKSHFFAKKSLFHEKVTFERKSRKMQKVTFERKSDILAPGDRKEHQETVGYRAVERKRVPLFSKCPVANDFFTF